MKSREDEDIDRIVGRRIRNRRKVMGMTQQVLAQACGVGFQQIQKYESAESGVSAARLWSLAAALEVPVTYFFEGLPTAAEPLVGPKRPPAPSRMKRRASGAG